MRIGIFTDTYHPLVNGIVYVTEILRRNFEAFGHEVFIFAPSPGLSGKSDDIDDHIIRFPAIGGIVAGADFNSSVFFPPKVLNRIEELNLDIIHFLTPGPVGLMGMYAAHKLDKPLVAEYCTDLFEYVKHYPLSAPGIFALGAVLPFTFRTSPGELLDMIKAARPRLGTTKWSREMVKHLITVMHSHCDAVIAHSRKSAEQMTGWQNEDEHYKIDIIPTGVDALPVASKQELADFRAQWHIAPEDEIITYVGRLSPEKNLEMLIDMIGELIKWRPNVKLMYVGDYPEYKPKLEEKAAMSPVADRIIFTGSVPHEELGKPFGVSRVFAFPSLTDTQSLALHEAAQAGLPIVMIDEPVTEVVHDNVNGYFCLNCPIKMAAAINKVLEDPARYKKMGAAGKKIAKKFSERTQAKKILDIYEHIIRSKASTAKAAYS